MIRSVLIYLDTCTWCRPFDDQTQDRIRDAKYFITTDEGISERAKCISKETGIFIINPIDFVEGRLWR